MYCSVKKNIRARSGITLLESMMAAVVLSIAGLGICTALSAAASTSGDADEAWVCASLAHQLAEEVSSMPLEDPACPPGLTPPLGAGGKQRQNFTCIANYHNFDDTVSSTATGLTTGAGTTVHGYKSAGIYTRKIAVEYRATPTGAAAATGNYAVATIVVTGTTGRSVTLYVTVARLTLTTNKVG